MNNNDGGPAFPNRWADGHEDMGMSLRDWFAGQALAGGISGSEDPDYTLDAMASDAYRIADAMLAQRNKED